MLSNVLKNIGHVHQVLANRVSFDLNDAFEILNV